MRELFIADFISEVKDVYGSCAILDTIDDESLLGFITFTKIAWNYMKMQDIKNKEAVEQ